MYPEYKIDLDKKVENEILERLTVRCDRGRRQVQSYMNMSRSYKWDVTRSEMYIKKAEEVDMTYCDALKRDREIIELFEER
jgi:hypothetical protein